MSARLALLRGAAGHGRAAGLERLLREALGVLDLEGGLVQVCQVGLVGVGRTYYCWLSSGVLRSVTCVLLSTSTA